MSDRSVAFLAIDLYNLVYRGGPGAPVDLDPQYPNSCGIYAHRAIEPTKRLFAAVRRAGIPVFYCTQDHRPQNRPDGAISTRRKEKPANAADHGIYHEFTPEPMDVIIYKQRASIFQGTPFLSHLNLLGIRSLIVCGESTSGCVRASTVDAYSNGFHVSIVEECTYDRSELIHKVNLFDLHHKYVDVMHLDRSNPTSNGSPLIIPTLGLGDFRDFESPVDLFKLANEGCLPWAKRCRLGRTTRPVRFGGLRSARRMGRKREDFWHLQRCWTGFRVKKQRGSAGWIARRCVTG